MSRERITLFDTTLRDGAQTNGVDFSVADKILIADLLDELGVDYVEGGYPGANPTDTRFFAEKRTARARFTALNDAYKARFGIPFIMAVKGASKAAILVAFEERLQHAPELEFAAALEQVETITLLRLRELLPSQPR